MLQRIRALRRSRSNLPRLNPVKEHMSKLRLLIAVVLVGTVAVTAQSRRAPSTTELAPGIFMFQTPGYGDVGLDGNSIAILSREGVLVFDTNGTPAASAAVLAQIRKLTDQPVRWIVNSHWHWDHWYGSQTYVDAYPEVRIVAHEKTRQLMMGPALEFNRPGLETQLPNYLKALEKRAGADPALQATLEEDRFFLDEKTRARHIFPNVTFTDRLNIELGERHIEVLHYDRAVTPGDALVYLPREQLLLAGDVIVNPVTFALSGYPTEWIRTLEKIDRLEFKTMVTGHGAPLNDRTLLHATLDVFRALLTEGRAAKKRGVTADQAREAILPSLHDLMVKITGDDASRNAAFQTQLVDWFLHRVFEELDGPLTDAIAQMPRS
jgi:cyclase